MALTSSRSLTKDAGISLTFVREISSSLYCSICKVAVAVSQMRCQLLGPWREALAEDAARAEERSKWFILGKVIP